MKHAGLLLLAALSCLMFACGSDSAPSDTNYSYDDDVLGAVELRALPGDTPESATATISNGDKQLDITVSGTDAAEMQWNGVTIDGYGPLTEPQRAALADYVDSGLALSAARAVLDLGCDNNSFEDAAQRAALVFPWQLAVKYSIDFPTLELLQDAKCVYSLDERALFDPETNISTTSHGVQIAQNDPFPHVFGYFALDDVGAMEITRRDHTEGSVCNAVCRGVCGPDCEPNACEFHFERECETDSAGENTGVEVLISVLECGSHQGCRDHDQCYDDCNTRHGCGFIAQRTVAAVCRRGCDADCIRDYNLRTCIGWISGNEPHDQTITYRHEAARQNNESECGPLQDPEDPSSQMTRGPLSGGEGSEQTFQFSVPAGHSKLVFTLIGEGDADMYISHGGTPTISEADCKSFGRQTNERCEFEPPAAGTYNVLIHGYESFSGAILTMSLF